MVFLIYILLMCARIRLAIAIMKTSVSYIRDVWHSLCVPPVLFIFIVGIYVYWLVACLHLYATGEIYRSNQDVFPSVSREKSYEYAFYFEVWGILWVNAFLIGMCKFILAGSVCIWYFSVNTDSGPQRAVSRPLYWSLRYHLGSIAFGSLVLSLVWTVKWGVRFTRWKSRNIENSNCCVRTVGQCASCIVSCFERFISFLNKNAYIQIALRSVGFCEAARDGFSLVLRNAARFITMGSIGSVFMFLGKWAISLLATYCGYLMIIELDTFSQNVYSPIIPSVVFFLLAYVISSVFMSVYSMACDTVLHCFLLDEEIMRSYGGREPEHIPSTLKEFLNKERSRD